MGVTIFLHKGSGKCKYAPVRSISIGVPKVYLTLDERIEPKVRKFKTIKVIRIAVTSLNHLSLYASQVAW